MRSVLIFVALALAGCGSRTPSQLEREVLGRVARGESGCGMWGEKWEPEQYEALARLIELGRVSRGEDGVLREAPIAAREGGAK